MFSQPWGTSLKSCMQFENYTVWSCTSSTNKWKGEFLNLYVSWTRATIIRIYRQYSSEHHTFCVSRNALFVFELCDSISSKEWPDKPMDNLSLHTFAQYTQRMAGASLCREDDIIYCVCTPLCIHVSYSVCTLPQWINIYIFVFILFTEEQIRHTESEMDAGVEQQEQGTYWKY